MAKNISTLVVGSGFIASNFNKYKNDIKKFEITIYAAGISNSLETNKINLKREVSKIKSFLKKNKKKIVYISTYSILDKSRSKKLYIKNKINIEKIIKKQSQNYLIIRLPEIIGKNKNSKTLTNFFFERIRNNKSFVLFQNAKRNILNIDDAIKRSIFLIKKNYKKNKTINLLNQNFDNPLSIVQAFEKILKKEAKYEMKKIPNYSFNLKNVFFVKTGKNYLINNLKKYYLK